MLGLLGSTNVWARQTEQIVPAAWATATDTLHVTGPGPFILNPWLVEGTLVIEHQDERLSSDLYHVDYPRGFVTFRNVQPDSSFTFTATYGFVPLVGVSGRMAWRRAVEGRREGAVHAPRQPDRRTSLVQRSGSVTRGVVAGSGRDANIESALRFELDGEIAPGVMVTATLTDEDTPVLPQGTTRRLDQFDRVFIRMASRQGEVELGDIETDLTSGVFGHVRRNLQGALGRTSAASPVRALFVGAVSRGRFRSQRLSTVDGVQGPYRLAGDRGEPFILIIPGSERVWLDGELQVRGDMSDYVIDYTTAEITFTSKNMIGQDRRVRVEFEYTTNQFSRSFLLADSWTQAQRNGLSLALGATVIREADGSAFGQELAFSADDSAAVINAGDGTAFRSGAREVEYNPEALFTQYFLTVTDDSINVFSVVDRVPTPSEKVYRVTFTFVGEGMGSYRRTGAQGNGIVFDHVGSGNGDYQPVIPLNAPGRQELVSFRFDLNGLPGIRIGGEWAGSRYDQNTLSSLDEDDDQGGAWSIQAESDRIGLNKRDIWFQSSVSSRFRTTHFTSFSRTRDVEFERKWNLEPSGISSNVVSGSSEHISSAHLTIGAMDSTSVSLGSERVILGSAFTGTAISARLLSAEYGFPILTADIERVRTRRDLNSEKGSWWRHNIRVDAPERQKIRPFVSWSREGLSAPGDRAAVSVEPDFTQWTAGATSHSSALTTFLRASIRDETRWMRPTSSTSARIWTVQGGVELDGSVGRWTADVGGRRTLQSGQPADDALLLSLTGAVRPTDRVRLDLLYDARSERSAILQEIYIRTGAERGQYVWDDFNEDGLIQLDEFIPETNPTEGEYVRTFLPGDSLEAVTGVNARLRFDIAPKSGIGARGIGWTSTVDVQETSRTSDRGGIYRLNPNRLQVPGQTVQGRIRVSQELALLPSIRSTDLNILVMKSQSLSGLATGNEERGSSVAEMRLRHRAVSSFDWSVRFGREVESAGSDSFASRAYDIVAWRTEPSVRYDLTDGFNLGFSPMAAFKTERISRFNARVLQLPVDVIWDVAGRIRSTARLEFARVRLNTERVGLTAWELTDGRGRGQSWLWRLGIQAELNEKLNARLEYDGRRPSSGRTIHTGRFQLTAFF